LAVLLLSIAKVSMSIGRAVGEQAEVDRPTRPGAASAARRAERAQRLVGLEVALALAQQPQVASLDVAVGDTGAHREV
jgi:hypothetical protein